MASGIVVNCGNTCTRARRPLCPGSAATAQQPTSGTSATARHAVRAHTVSERRRSLPHRVADRPDHRLCARCPLGYPPFMLAAYRLAQTLDDTTILTVPPSAPAAARRCEASRL